MKEREKHGTKVIGNAKEDMLRGMTVFSFLSGLVFPSKKGSLIHLHAHPPHRSQAKPSLTHPQPHARDV